MRTPPFSFVRGTTGCCLRVGDSVVGPGFHETSGKIDRLNSDRVVDIRPENSPHISASRIDLEAAKAKGEPVEHSGVCWDDCYRMQERRAKSRDEPWPPKNKEEDALKSVESPGVKFVVFLVAN